MNSLNDYSFILEEEDPQLRAELSAQLGLTDLYFFSRYIMGGTNLEETTDLHFRLCEEMSGLAAGDYDRLAVMLFRNAYKTSFSIWWLIQCLCRFPNVQIGIGSDTKERAQKRLLDLRTKLEHNQLLKALYPQVFYQDPAKESPVWRAEELDVKRDYSTFSGFMMPSVSCFGLDPLPTGSHYDIVYIDDVENEVNCDNPEQIDKLLRNFKAFLPTLNPNSKLLLTGTIYAEDGPNTYYQKVWRTYKRPIWDALKRPSFPSRWPDPEKIRREINDPWLWAGQYMLETHPRTDKFFYPFSGVELNSFSLIDGTIHAPTETVSLEKCALYLTIDSGGGASAEQVKAAPKLVVDGCGFCLMAVSPTNKWYVLDLWIQYLSDEQLVDRMFELEDSHKLALIGVEKIHHLDAFIRLSFKVRKRVLHITPLLPKKRKKSDRIRGLKPLLPDIYFEKKIKAPYQSRLRGWYTDQEHDDDDHDAFAYMIDVAHQPTKEQLSGVDRKYANADTLQRMNALPAADKREWEKTQVIYSESSPKEQYIQELEDFFA